MRRSLARDTLYYAAASPARVKAPRAAKLPQMTLPLGATSGGIKVFWGFSLGSTSEWGHPRKPQNDPQSTHRMEMKWKQILAPLPTAHGRDRLGMALACTLLHLGDSRLPLGEEVCRHEGARVPADQYMMADANLRTRVRRLTASGKLPRERPLLRRVERDFRRMGHQFSSEPCLICGECMGGTRTAPSESRPVGVRTTAVRCEVAVASAPAAFRVRVL